MRMVSGILALLFLSTLAGCGENADDYVRSIDEWHARRLENLQAEDGWLTLVGLYELHGGANTLGAAESNDVRLAGDVAATVGVIACGEDGATFTPAADAEVTTAAGPVTGPIALATDAGGEPTILHTSTLSFHVIERGDRRFLRVKDSASAVRRDFAGIDRFGVDPAWRVTARLDTVGVAATVPIVNVLGQVEPTPSPGVLRFEIGGQTLQLVPVGEAGEPLFLVFGDLTNGHETYGGGRFLSTEPPAPDGTVVIDFNKATNPPCAFTPYATCPLPPDGNRLPLRVTAGEKAWGSPH